MAFDYVDGKGRLTSSYKGAVMPAMYPALELADFYAEFDFQAPAAAPYSGYGFIFRSDDTEGGSLDWYYMLRIRPVEGTISLHGWLDPDWVVHEDFTLPLGLLDPAGFNRVRLEARGGEFRVFVNGAFIFEFTDTTLVDPGIFGFLIVPSEEMEEGEEDFVYFDNLRIYGRGESEALVPTGRPADTPAPTVLLHDGDARHFDIPLDIIAYANVNYASSAGGVTITDSGQLWRYHEWITLMQEGQWIEATYAGMDTTKVGVQFWGDTNDGWARVLVDGIEV